VPGDKPVPIQPVTESGEHQADISRSPSQANIRRSLIHAVIISGV
jgi:hypothetical protein